MSMGKKNHKKKQKKKKTSTESEKKESWCNVPSRLIMIRRTAQLTRDRHGWASSWALSPRAPGAAARVQKRQSRLTSWGSAARRPAAASRSPSSTPLDELKKKFLQSWVMLVEAWWDNPHNASLSVVMHYQLSVNYELALLVKLYLLPR